MPAKPSQASTVADAPADSPDHTPGHAPTLAGMDQAAIAQWFSDNERALFRYALSLVHHRETALDAVQDTFVRLCEQDDLASIQTPKAWLYTVCRRRCYDLNAKANTQGKHMATQHPTTPDTQTDTTRDRPDQHALNTEMQQKALACLDKLPELQREALRLKLQAGLAYKDIADVMNKSVNHVGVLIHQGIKKMQQQLAAEGLWP